MPDRTIRPGRASRPVLPVPCRRPLTGLFAFCETLLQSALDPFRTAAALAALALAVAQAHRPARWFVVAGIAFGLEALNRPNVVAAPEHA